MRKTILSLSFILAASVGFTHAQDVLKKHGFKKKPLTFCDGQYNEFFNNPEVVQIGTTLFNTKTNKVVKLLDDNTPKTTYKAESSSMCIDPHAEKYYSISPYAYALNNPVKYIDPDGKLVRDQNGNIVFNATNTNATYIQYANKDQNTGITTVVYFNATQGNILTDKGNEVTAFRANDPNVRMAQIDASGKVVSNEVINQQFENGYNCTGNALADKAFTISSDAITPQYMQDEGLKTLSPDQQTQTGDIGIYKDNSSGVITHFEPFLTNSTVSTKGGIAVDNGPVSPGQNTPFANGATYSVVRKTQPNTTVNVTNGTVTNGVNQVNAETFNKIKSTVQNP